MGTAIPNIPGFEFAALLGRGGMGEVWKARQQGIDRWVAVKVLHPNLSEDEEYVQRFLREARTVGKLSHENIVRAFDCGQAGGRNYLVMEFVEGRPLDRLLAERRVFEERDALLLARSVARALQHAWDHRIIHRDVKPQNVLVTPDGTPKLCDLGLSRDVSEKTRLTMTGAIACTPAYASPEQAHGETGIDTRMDIYSLGVMLYELVTGELPFQSASPAALLVKHVSEAPRPPIARNPRLSPGANRLILEMLEKLPARRPQTPDALVTRIDDLLEGRDSAAPKTTRHAGPRRRRAPGGGSSSTTVLAVGGGIAAVAVVILAVALSGRESPAPAPRPRPPAPVARPAPPGPEPTPAPPLVPLPAPPARTAPATAPARAEAALQALRAFRASHPDDLPAQIRETEKALLDLDGTPHFEATRRDLESLKTRRREELARVRAELDGQVKEAIAKENFRAALQAWKEAAARHPDAPWASEEASQVAGIQKAAEALYAPLAAQAAEAARKGEGAAVEAIRKRVAAWGLPGLAQLLEGAVAANALVPKPPAVPPDPAPPAPVPPPATVARRAPPDSADRGKIRTRVKDLYRNDYAKPTVAAARALAEKLLEAARQAENDAANRYVLLEEARDQAARGADATLAFAAVEQIAAGFDLDARKEWDIALGKLKTTTRDPASARGFAWACLEQARAAIRGDDYDLAADFLKAVESAIGRSEDQAALSAAHLRISGQLQRARAAAPAARKSRETLKSNPDDPEANLAVGRYLCVVKEDWPRGLDHLLKGSDPKLREAAARERAAGTDVAKLAEAADGWTAAGEAFGEHALELYKAAWPGLAGERRDRVRDRFLRAALHPGAVKDGSPAEWFIGKQTRRELYRMDGTRARSGRSSLRVDAGGSTGWMSLGHFPTLEGKEFEFSGWLLSEQTAEWDLCSVYFYADPAQPPIEGVHLRAPADQPWWTQLRVRLKAPVGAKSFQIMVTCGFPKGTMWVDDLSLRELASREEFVVNRSFER